MPRPSAPTLEAAPWHADGAASRARRTPASAPSVGPRRADAARMTADGASRSSRCAASRSTSPSRARRLVRRDVGARAAPSTASASTSRGRDARPGGRVGLRQVHARRACIAAAARADRRATVLFDGQRPHRASAARSCARSGATMQIVFQDPYASLNPRMTRRRDRRREPLDDPSARPADASARRGSPSCCEQVGPAARSTPTAIPHEFSGGQRQRIGIARALALQPALHRRRRAGLGARRVDPGADPQPARDLQERARADLPVHRPRPGGGAPHLRPRSR